MHLSATSFVNISLKDPSFQSDVEGLGLPSNAAALPDAAPNGENSPYSQFVVGSNLLSKFHSIHITQPGVSVIPAKWSKDGPLKGQDRAFKRIWNVLTATIEANKNCTFMGIFDGVSGGSESKSELVAQYFAEGICQAIEESQNGEFLEIINQGYRIACLNASENSQLFPHGSTKPFSAHASTTISCIQLSNSPEISGTHIGKYRARILVLGDSAVVIYRKKKMTANNLCGKPAGPSKPGQIFLLHKDLIHPQIANLFWHVCYKIYPEENLKEVRKYYELYLDKDDIILAASDGVWDNLNYHDVFEIICSLEEAYGGTSNKSFPFAYVIAEIANELSKKPWGKRDDISIVVSRAGRQGDVAVNTTMMRNYDSFILENVEFFSSRHEEFHEELEKNLSLITTNPVAEASASADDHSAHQKKSKRKRISSAKEQAGKGTPPFHHRYPTRFSLKREEEKKD